MCLGLLELSLFNFYAEHIMRKAGLGEAQAGTKIAGRKINNLRYADDTTLALVRLQKYPKIHVGTGEESSGSVTDSTQDLRPQHQRERNPERPPCNCMGTGLS